MKTDITGSHFISKNSSMPKNPRLNLKYSARFLWYDKNK